MSVTIITKKERIKTEKIAMGKKMCCYSIYCSEFIYYHRIKDI